MRDHLENTPPRPEDIEAEDAEEILIPDDLPVEEDYDQDDDAMEEFEEG